MKSASAREKDLGMDYTAEVSSENLFLCRQGNMTRRMTKEKTPHSFIPFRSFVIEVRFIFQLHWTVRKALRTHVVVAGCV